MHRRASALGRGTVPATGGPRVRSTEASPRHFEGNRGGSDRTDWLRGGLTGVLTAAVAIAAHGSAGGGLPGSTGATLLLLAAGVIGVLASNLPRATSRIALPALMAVGQPVCHVALSGLAHGGHGAEPGGFASGSAELVSDGAMAAAHMVAAIACALLILTAERLYGLVSQAIRVVCARPGALPVQVSVTAWTGPRITLKDLLTAGAAGPRAPPVTV